MNTDTLTLDAVPTKEQPNQLPQVTVDNALITFDLTQLKIQQLRDEESRYSIAGPDDKTGASALNEFRLMVMRQRTSVEKKAKELKAPHIRYNKEVDAASNALTQQLEAIEDKAKLKLKQHNDEVERIATENMLAQQRRTEARHKELVGYGYVWNGALEAYQREQDTINFDDLKNLSDDEYEPIASAAGIAYKIEQERLAQEAADEAERVRLQRIADQEAAEKLAQGQAELKLAQQKLREQQEELDRQAKAIDDANRAAFALEQQKEEQAERQAQQELTEKRLSKYTPLLIKAGLSEVGGEFFCPGISTPATDEAELMSLTDGQFDHFLARIKSGMQDRKEAEKALKVADKARTTRLSAEKKDFARYLKTCFPAGDDLGYQQPEVVELVRRFNAQMQVLVNEFIEHVEML